MIAAVAGTAAVLSTPTVAAAPAGPPGLDSVVVVTMKATGTLEIDSDLVPVTTVDADTAYACTAVDVGEGRTLTSVRCVDPSLDFVVDDLRSLAINIANDWSLSTSQAAELKATASKQQWKITSSNGHSPAARYTVQRRMTRGGPVVSMWASRVAINDNRLALLRSRSSLPNVPAAQVSTVPVQVGARVSVPALDPERTGGSTPASTVPTRTVTAVGRGRVTLDSKLESSSFGGPVFDSRRRLVGILSSSGPAVTPVTADVLRRLLAQAPPPSSTAPARTSSATETPVDRAASHAAAPSTPTSTWAKVALGVGILDVVVFGAVVVAYRRRRG
ncbi:hypothetical protein ACH46_07690 [Gordonia phthalatica]|uniref:Peptidase S1 domain-containing protein n=1 Tax=Gordonia phthalatica TaxID=1136941 RepID=A0A0N9N1A5_9ACTN|nr:hypothetical protein ACH46_07690 [Gordonia phthalatica]